MSQFETMSLKDLLPGISDADILSEKLKHQVARFIYLYRVKRNMQQKQLAEKLGISQGMVSKWEGSSINFSIETLASMLSELNTDAEFVLTSKDLGIVTSFPYTETTKPTNTSLDEEYYLSNVAC